MYQSNELVYQLLLNQIQTIMDKDFIQSLRGGKYSDWAEELEPEQVLPMLAAIGEYGRLGSPCPDVDTQQMLCGKSLDEVSGITILLNQVQLKALEFLAMLVLHPTPRLDIPADYTHKSTHFAENVNWAIDLTRNDLFGIIWHTGGYGIRGFSGFDINTINTYAPRSQEALICLMRVAQGKPTSYQVAGERFLLREDHIDDPTGARSGCLTHLY